MALDIHCLNLLRLGAKAGVDYAATLTVSRPALFLSDEELAGFLRALRLPGGAADLAKLKVDGYSEPLLRAAFGAQEVVALDASSYEGAGLIHDMNLPLRAGREFSAVLDFGCLEHVFNFPVALANVIGLCRPGGHILHALPANNWCGHGFYQFSPEMFFSVYADRRGFRATRVFLAEFDRPSRWYEVRNPIESGKRVNVINREKTYVLVMTQKTAHTQSPLEHPPQQADYAVEWSKPARRAQAASQPATASPRRAISRTLGLSALARSVRVPLRGFRSRVLGHSQALRGSRPDLKEIDIAALLGD
jgi:SAM-dependent methyltransferase